jgi:[ribosomal protein S18]-alanine N-acetyltransferase
MKCLYRNILLIFFFTSGQVREIQPPSGSIKMKMIKTTIDIFKKGKRKFEDRIGYLLIQNKWKKIEKEDIDTVNTETLKHVLSIYKNNFNREDTTQLDSYSKIFRDILYVMENEDGTVGYCGYYIKPGFSSRGLKIKSVIYSFAIDKTYRKKKYGEKLLIESIKEMKFNKISSIELYVNENNLPAIKLYEKVGFHTVEKAIDMLGQDEKYNKMELELM